MPLSCVSPLLWVSEKPLMFLVCPAEDSHLAQKSWGRIWKMTFLLHYLFSYSTSALIRSWTYSGSIRPRTKFASVTARGPPAKSNLFYYHYQQTNWHCGRITESVCSGLKPVICVPKNDCPFWWYHMIVTHVVCLMCYYLAVIFCVQITANQRNTKNR